MENKEVAINRMLNRGVEEIIDRGHLERALRSDKKLRVKFGIDPTKPDIHLGHTVPLLKLREFQNLGHKAVLIIGDFTAQIGDPSGQSAERKSLTEKEVKLNMKHYLEQAGKVVNLKKAEIVYNSKWLRKLNGGTLAKLLSLVSVQQILEREDFKKRLEGGKSLRVHEMLYPILQGYDSVVIKSDVEIGGTDQKFNLLTGRTLMERMGLPPQDILTVPLIEGTDGVRKMSKSFGNYIGINDTPDDMFGKIMSIPDTLIGKYFTLLTNVTPPAVDNPRDAKIALALEIVKTYHSEVKAVKARENFIRTFSQKEIPDDAQIVKIKSNNVNGTYVNYLVDVIVLSGSVASKSEARRLIGQGAIEINKKLQPQPITITIHNGDLLKIGKHRFFKFLIN
ncbi:MAG: tyrosine--tRNA ligase [Patescibacteria group bacterium]|nr:tyrosine--tRNA ligase [Patescibacteria group bacterium]MCL5224150.1 tyrosine--tRNA ligase [Patescibacteria group bacterium]